MREGESVEDLIKCLRVKHLRCYLLAKEQRLHYDSADSDSLEGMTDIVQREVSAQRWHQFLEIVFQQNPVKILHKV